MGLQMKYFVLKPEGDSEYSRASRKAMLAYAKSIMETDSELAYSLIEWANKEAGKSLAANEVKC